MATRVFTARIAVIADWQPLVQPCDPIGRSCGSFISSIAATAGWFPNVCATFTQ